MTWRRGLSLSLSLSLSLALALSLSLSGTGQIRGGDQHGGDGARLLDDLRRVHPVRGDHDFRQDAGGCTALPSLVISFDGWTHSVTENWFLIDEFPLLNSSNNR